MKGFKIFISYSPSSNSHLRTILKQKKYITKYTESKKQGFQNKRRKESLPDNGEGRSEADIGSKLKITSPN